MFHIERVEIEGFWGRFKAAADFHPDVNIFIGRNGSGKTTFMDLLYGVLRVDLRILALHEFKAITLRLSAEDHIRTIKVTKERHDAPVELLRFQVGNRAFRFPFYSPEMDTARHMRLRPHLEASFQALKTEIAQLVNVASLSVHRSAYEPVAEEEFHSRQRQFRPPIDERLQNLLRGLTAYQLQLAEEVGLISTHFQRAVLTSILFHKDFDTWNPAEAASADLPKQQEELTKAYKELGALTPDVSHRIAEHFEAIGKSISTVQSQGDKRTAIAVNDVFPFPLLRRSQHITKLLSEAEAKKQRAHWPIHAYEEALENYISDKRVRISLRGQIGVTRGEKAIGVSQLSSGEKQLVVLLTEALLQRSQPYVFLADEPELSLHIDWQEKIIGSLRALNPNAQVVVATHSPEIAAGWTNHLLDMTGVIRG